MSEITLMENGKIASSVKLINEFKNNPKIEYVTEKVEDDRYMAYCTELKAVGIGKDTSEALVKLRFTLESYLDCDSDNFNLVLAASS